MEAKEAKGMKEAFEMDEDKPRKASMAIKAYKVRSLP